MSVYAVSSCCGSTLDTISDPHVYIEHGLTTEFYCTERRCLAEAFGECIDDIFGIFTLAPAPDADELSHHGLSYADEDRRVVCMYPEMAE